MIAAQREGCGIHDAKIFRNRLVKRQFGVFRRVRILLGVFAVNTIHLGGLQHDLSANFCPTQRCSRVSGEKWVSRTGCKNDHFAFFKVLQRLGSDVRFDHLLNGNCRHHARDQTRFVHGVTQRQRVHDRGQHTHVVSGCPIHSDRAARYATKNIAPSDHHRHFDPEAGDLGHLIDHPDDGVPVDAKLVVAHQGLTRQLEQNSLVGWLGCGHGGLLLIAGRQDIELISGCHQIVGLAAAATVAATSAAKSSTFFSMPSPTTNKVKDLSVVFEAFSICSTVSLSFLTNA